MSYNPISFNVIRQALTWQHIPPPQLTKLSSYKLPDGTMTSVYRAVWDYKAIVSWAGYKFNPDGYELTYFCHAVSSSFCEDITCLGWGYNDKRQQMAIDLHVRAPKRDKAG